MTDLARQPVPATATVAPLGPPGLGARPAAASPALLFSKCAELSLGALPALPGFELITLRFGRCTPLASRADTERRHRSVRYRPSGDFDVARWLVRDGV